MEEKNYFNVNKRKLSDGSILHIIDIEDITKELEELIDQNIPQIHSASDYDLESTKKILRSTFGTDKKPYHVPDVKMGTIAEFFIHLYFIHLGFKQECLLQNLEETNGVKKGFDGYYSLDEDEWLMESKSTRDNKTHKDNIKKAYIDLSEKIAGRKTSSSGKILSPWDNALKHAKQAGSNQNILNNIKKLSKNFINGRFADIKDFNIIPSSTIFFDNKWEVLSPEEIHAEIDSYMSSTTFNKLNVVCITQKTVDLFLDYLNK